ncbi:MAG: ABC transporter ATP-binding protein [Rhodobacterales bacterium]|nr:ABC transporter ATP-binding protein [Rhodobacterales bacterium]
MQPFLKVDQVTKRFHQVVANDQVSFDVLPGEIHCLLGENGAGKSTIAECIYGFYRPDEGMITVEGNPDPLTSPRDAIARGIGMVHQHFVLVSSMTVLENIVIGTDAATPILDLKGAVRRIQEICDRYSVDIDLNARIWQLPVGQQQWVEILKALFQGARLLIMDEPTAVLTPQEARRLFQIFREMTAEAMSVILISHKFDDVMQSDRVTVLRRGKVVNTVNTRETTKEALTNMMVGRSVELRVKRDAHKSGAPMLEVRDLRAMNDFGTEKLSGINLTVNRGEIVGIAGVAGNGQGELFETLIGVRKAASGTIRLDGEDITGRSPAEIQKRGMGHIPDDRFADGLVGDFDIQNNLILGHHRKAPFSRAGFLNFGEIRSFARNAIAEFDIKAPSETTRTRSLSGGNAQKVIVAREFDQATKMVLANQPSRGLDVGVIEYMHERLLDKRRSDFGVLLASEELGELLSLADRILVIFKGRILGEFTGEDANIEQIGLLMAGQTSGHAPERLS